MNLERNSAVKAREEMKTLMDKMREDRDVMKANLKKTIDENEKLIKKLGDYERKNDKL